MDYKARIAELEERLDAVDEHMRTLREYLDYLERQR